MAWDNPTKVLSFPAAGDLSSFQFYAVALTTAGKVTTISTTATKPLGVLQDAPSAADEMCSVAVEGVSKMLVYGGTVAVNDALGIDTSGRGAPTTTDNQWVIGDALEAITDAGTNVIIPVMLSGVHRY